MFLSPKFQLLEIQYVLKLKRRSMVFIWVEASILMDIIISLTPYWWNYFHQRNTWPWILYLFQDLLPLHWSCLQCQFIWTLKEEFPLWHWKLGISMHCIQELMQSNEAHESSGICHEMPPIITHIFKSTPNLKTPHLCQSYACSKHRMPKVNQPPMLEMELVLRCLWSWWFCFCH